MVKKSEKVYDRNQKETKSSSSEGWKDKGF